LIKAEQRRYIAVMGVGSRGGGGGGGFRSCFFRSLPTPELVLPAPLMAVSVHFLVKDVILSVRKLIVLDS